MGEWTLRDNGGAGLDFVGPSGKTAATLHDADGQPHLVVHTGSKGTHMQAVHLAVDMPSDGRQRGTEGRGVDADA